MIHTCSKKLHLSHIIQHGASFISKLFKMRRGEAGYFFKLSR